MLDGFPSVSCQLVSNEQKSKFKKYCLSRSRPNKAGKGAELKTNAMTEKKTTVCLVSIFDKAKWHKLLHESRTELHRILEKDGKC